MVHLRTLRARRALALLAVLPILAFALPRAWAYPKPSLVNPSWSFEFSFDTPRAISVQAVTGEVRWYWYMPYKVVNHGDQARPFIPEIVVYNDLGRIKPAGQGVPASVFPAIAKQLRDPLVLSPIAVVGPLLVGEDHAKQSVAIWPASQQDVDHFSVFVGGLSGDVAKIKNPRTGDRVLLRRTLMLRFSLPGHPATPDKQSVNLTKQQEIMR